MIKMMRTIEIKKNGGWVETKGFVTDDMICQLEGCNRKIPPRHKYCSNVHACKDTRNNRQKGKRRISHLKKAKEILMRC